MIAVCAFAPASFPTQSWEGKSGCGLTMDRLRSDSQRLIILQLRFFFPLARTLTVTGRTLPHR